MSLILLIVLLVIVLGALPVFPYSANYGWGPSGGIGIILLILVLLYFFGGFGWGYHHPL